MKISKYFTAEELSCRCGCGACYMHKDQLVALDKLRYVLGSPLYATSGFRCREHNAEVGGHPNSFHKLGKATDVHSLLHTPEQIAARARDFFKEVIPHPEKGFCHLGDPKQF